MFLTEPAMDIFLLFFGLVQVNDTEIESHILTQKKNGVSTKQCAMIAYLENTHFSLVDTSSNICYLGNITKNSIQSIDIPNGVYDGMFNTILLQEFYDGQFDETFTHLHVPFVYQNPLNYTNVVHGGMYCYFDEMCDIFYNVLDYSTSFQLQVKKAFEIICKS